MYQKLKCNNKQDYFKPLSEREKNGVYFCRFIGFDEDYKLPANKMENIFQKNYNNQMKVQ